MELNSLQKLIGWLESSLAWYKGIKLLFHSFCSAVFGLLHQSVQTQKNITVYFIILYFHTDKPFLKMRSCLFLWTCETSLPKNPCNFQNITVVQRWLCSIRLTELFFCLYFLLYKPLILCTYTFIMAIIIHKNWHKTGRVVLIVTLYCQSLLSGIHHTYQVRVQLTVETQAVSECSVPNHTVPYCTDPYRSVETIIYFYI